MIPAVFPVILVVFQSFLELRDTIWRSDTVKLNMTQRLRAHLRPVQAKICKASTRLVKKCKSRCARLHEEPAPSETSNQEAVYRVTETSLRIQLLRRRYEMQRDNCIILDVS